MVHLEMFTLDFKEAAVGGTLFTRLRNMEELLGFRQLYAKFEAGNPTGTMKDRASYAILDYAKGKGYTAVAVASCGNYGMSMVRLGRLFGLETHVFIPRRYRSPRVEEMEGLGGRIHRTPGTYEDAVEACALESLKQGWYNGNPGVGVNSELSYRAYASISREIVDSLGCAPHAVAVSTGNGTCLAGLHQGFKWLLGEGAIEGLPSMVACSTSGGNPIVSSFQRGERVVGELEPSSVVETPVNEPIVNWRSLDGQAALDALYESHGAAYALDDEEMRQASRQLRMQEGLSVLPASAAAVAGLSRYVEEARGGGEGIYVAVLTSRDYEG